MDKTERALWKQAIKGCGGYLARRVLLLYAYRRGMPYRRVERKTGDHNKMTAQRMWDAIDGPVLPELRHLFGTRESDMPALVRWLNDGVDVYAPVIAPKRKPHPVYVIVRGDLMHAQQAVQGMHAAQVFASHNHGMDFSQTTLVFVTVPSETALRILRDECVAYVQAVSAFMEPDMDNALTAICAQGGYVTNACRKLPLFSVVS